VVLYEIKSMFPHDAKGICVILKLSNMMQTGSASCWNVGI
jgi:hypothetical protein